MYVTVSYDRLRGYFLFVIMDFEKYEKYMNARAAVRKENERRIAEKFSECEKYIAENYINPQRLITAFGGCFYLYSGYGINSRGAIPHSLRVSHLWEIEGMERSRIHC
mgnify:CR=1 FL=1